jgi:hypothetical protein
MKLALCLALLGVQAFAGEVIYGAPPAGVIPHVVDGDGWKTIFTLVNLDSAAASFTLRFYADNGTPIAFPTASGSSSTITGTLPAGGATTIETSGTAVPLTQGWASLDAPGIIGGTAIFRRIVSGQPNYESSEALDFDTRSHYAMPFDHLNGAATGFAIVNQTAGTSGTITMIFRDESGAQLLPPQTFTLVGLGHTAFTLTQQYPALIGKRGTFEVSTTGVYINLLAMHFLNGSFTAITPLASWQWQ